MTRKTLPVGKLPFDLLAQVLAQAHIQDPRVVLGPGIGLDCAVIDIGPRYLVLKSDPITFATDEIGWYAVQVNANDIATTGAIPRWLLVTLLLPEQQTTSELVARISQQVASACQQIGVSVIGGHTEITTGLDRPILVGTLIGEVEHAELVTPRGAAAGERILLTKGVPIEGTAILAREFAARLQSSLSPVELEQAQAFLYEPGISVLREAQVARAAGRVTAMHDPTEGGLSGALWELAEASGRALHIDVEAVPVPALAQRICKIFEIDPLATIASGALLLTAPVGEAALICVALEQQGIACTDIGEVGPGPAAVWIKTGGTPAHLPRPARDEIARLFSE